MPRFSILEHDHPTRHWDLLLESGDILKAWRLPAVLVPGETQVAEASFDHRKLYLDYEGPISGDRGRVVRWDWGLCEWQQSKAEEIRVYLKGTRLRGWLNLKHETGERWQILFEATDPF